MTLLPLQLSPEDQKKHVEAIGYGCIKYADLSTKRTNDYVFDANRMLSDKGNTAVYLLYAYARIQSIFRTPEVAALDLARLRLEVSWELGHAKERQLAECLLRFPEVVGHVLEVVARLWGKAR